MDRYTALPRVITALQWDGSNLEEIRELVGSTHASAIDGGITLLVMEEGRELRSLKPDDWVSLDEAGRIFVHSKAAFQVEWRKLPDND